MNGNDDVDERVDEHSEDHHGKQEGDDRPEDDRGPDDHDRHEHYGNNGHDGDRRGENYDDDRPQDRGDDMGDGSGVDGSGDVQDVSGMSGSVPVRPVYLGNLKFDCTPIDVQDVFEHPVHLPGSAGPGRPIPVDRIDLKRGFCFVFLKDAASEEAKHRAEEYVVRIHGMRIDRVSDKLRSEFARGDGPIKKKEDVRRKNIQPNETLFVVGFHQSTTRREDLESLFSPYGDLVRIDMKNNYAFVQFRTVEESTRAMEATNMGKLDQSIITVEYVASQMSSRPPPRREYGPPGSGSGGFRDDRGRPDDRFRERDRYRGDDRFDDDYRRFPPRDSRYRGRSPEGPPPRYGDRGYHDRYDDRDHHRRRYSSPPRGGGGRYGSSPPRGGGRYSPPPGRRYGDDSPPRGGGGGGGPGRGGRSPDRGGGRFDDRDRRRYDESPPPRRFEGGSPGRGGGRGGGGPMYDDRDRDRDRERYSPPRGGGPPGGPDRSPERFGGAYGRDRSRSRSPGYRGGGQGVPGGGDRSPPRGRPYSDEYGGRGRP